MDQATEALLYPYVTTPRRIALDVIAALEGCAAVARIAVYGSLAPFGANPHEGGSHHDGYSDIDLLVDVAGEDGPWQAAAALRGAMPLRWHGVFSDRPAPSGRHWPLGEAPFHCIDIGFVDAPEFDTILRGGLRGHPLRADTVLERPGVAAEGRPRLEICSDEYEFTHALYLATKALKAYLRNDGAWDDLAAAMKALEAAVRTLRVHPPGSDPEDLLNEVRTLYFALMNERLRYGGDR